MGVTPRVLSNINLPEEPKCLAHRNPCQGLVGKVTPANQVLPVVLLMETSGGSTCSPQKGWILEEWPETKQEQTRELLLKWYHLFASSDLDLGKTSLIKHWIKITDWMPFKEY